MVTVAYLVAASAFGTAFLRARSQSGVSPAPVWASFAVVTVLLGLNKQLDLQLALTRLGREMSQAQGWYQERAVIQVAFLAMVVVATLGFALWVLWAGRNHLKETLPATVGMMLVLVFVLMRAASFDVRTTRLVVADYEATWLLEPLGLIVAIAGTIRWLRRT